MTPVYYNEARLSQPKIRRGREGNGRRLRNKKGRKGEKGMGGSWVKGKAEQEEEIACSAIACR